MLVTCYFSSPFFSKESFHEHLIKHHKGIDTKGVDCFEKIDFYSRSIGMMIGWLHEAIKDSVLGDVWNLVVCYQKIVICMEDVGTMRSLGIIYLSQSGFRNDNAYNRFVQVNSSSFFFFSSSFPTFMWGRCVLRDAFI